MKTLKRTRQLAVTSLAVLAILIISLSWTLADPSPSSERWSSTFGGSDEDFGQSVQETRDGGYIIAGSTRSYGAGLWDVYLVKVDPEGNEMWSSTFGGANDDRGWSVQETSDGGYIIAGETNSSGAGGSDVYIVKVDPQGGETWSSTFGGPEDDVGYSIQETRDGGYIVAGFTYSFGAGGTDVYLVKVDSQGREEWNGTLGGSEDDYV